MARRSKHRERLLALSTATLLTASGGGAQSPAREPQPEVAPAPFVETVDVNVVNVEVYVTDRHGRPVRGLTKDDFEVLEDGRPVEITNFYAVDEGRPATPEPPPAEAPGPSRTAGGTAPDRAAPGERTVPEEQRLYLIVYVDNLFIRPFNRNKVLDNVQRFIFEHADRDDRIMLVTYDRSLHVRHPFTTEHGAVLDAIDEIRKLSALGVQARTQRRDLLRRIDSSRDAREAISHVDFYAKELHLDLQQSIEHLKEMVGSLAGLPGRKALLYVSDGIPMTPAEDLFVLVDQKFGGDTTSALTAARYRSRRQFNELTARANANRVSFYTIEAAGMTSHGSLSAEYGGREGSILEADVMMEANREEPLLLLADATGGLASINTNNFAGAFEAMARDFDNYYSLGYAPAHAVSGRYHEIEVRVRRSGVQVRHRSGYRDKTPETRVYEGTLAALIHGAERNPLGIRVDAERGRPSERGHYNVPVLVRIPLGRVALLPQSGRHRGELRVSVAVIDEQGRLSPVHQQPVPIDVPEADLATALGQDFVYEVELLMRGGRQVVGVGVRDAYSGDTSFVRQPVRVGT